MFGGRIVADKLWFYSGFRQAGAKNTVPGMFWNKNAGDPTKWIVDFDRSQPAFTLRVERQATIRVTWQATPRNLSSICSGPSNTRLKLWQGGGAGRPAS